MARARRKLYDALGKVIQEHKKECHHEYVETVEVEQCVVFEKKRPIVNSRIESLNDYQHNIEVRTITVPVVKCMECGEILGDNWNRHLNTQEGIAVSNGNNNMAIGAYSSGACSIAFGYNSSACATNYAGNYNVNNDTTRIIMDKNYNDSLKSYQEKLEDIERKIQILKENGSSRYNSMTANTYSQTESVNHKVANINDYVDRYKKIKTNKDMPSSLMGLVENVGSMFVPQRPTQQQQTGLNVGGLTPTFLENDQSNPKNTPIDSIGYMKVMFTGVKVEDKVFEDIKYIDFIFRNPVDQDDSKLNILESGDVLKWEKIPKNKKLGILSPKVNAIKSIRISKEGLEKAHKKIIDGYKKD